jgi:type VI secretion system activator RovC-like protein
MDSPLMQTPPLDPPVADTAPTDRALTAYDEQHLVTYLRLLDAEKDGAHWQEVAKLVLHIDPISEPVRARRAWETHLARARWMTENGYRHLLRGGAPH